MSKLGAIFAIGEIMRLLRKYFVLLDVDTRLSNHFLIGHVN